MKTKRTRTKLALILLALGSALTFLAFSVWSPQDSMADEPDPNTPPGPVGPSGAVPIPELPFKITESGSYCLTQNLTHTDRYTNAIEVDANNVTIDLGGFSIIGPTTSYNETCSGIYMNMRKNVEIRNGTITNFPNRGIFADSSTGFFEPSGNRIISIRVTSIGAEGILLWGLHDTITNCTVTNTQLELEQGYGGISCGALSSVTGNVVARHNIVGILTGSGCTIRDNTISECSYGIAPGDGCSIVDNTISFMFEGISILDTDGCLVRGNTVRECQGNGISIEGLDNAIEANLVTSCEVGFFFAYNQNVYANNRALFNGTNFGGLVPTGVYDGGGNIGAGTFVGGNVGAKLQLEAKPRILKKRIGEYGLTSPLESRP
jgi:parallel beta-helix repeat protein